MKNIKVNCYENYFLHCVYLDEISKFMHLLLKYI